MANPLGIAGRALFAEAAHRGARAPRLGPPGNYPFRKKAKS